MQELTERQEEFLRFLTDYFDANSKSPTFSEIQENFDYGSKNSCTYFLLQLERKGKIKYHRGRYRGVELLPITEEI